MPVLARLYNRMSLPCLGAALLIAPRWQWAVDGRDVQMECGWAATAELHVGFPADRLTEAAGRAFRDRCVRGTCISRLTPRTRPQGLNKALISRRPRRILSTSSLVAQTPHESYDLYCRTKDLGVLRTCGDRGRIG